MELRKGVARGRTVVLAGQEVVQGIPTAAVIFRSTDGGHTLQRTRVPGADVADVAVEGETVYASVSREGRPGLLLRSTDLTRWSEVPGIPPTESGLGLALTEGFLWTVSDTALRLGL
jgi:hypothetical protein